MTQPNFMQYSIGDHSPNEKPKLSSHTPLQSIDFKAGNPLTLANTGSALWSHLISADHIKTNSLIQMEV